jgi:trimethylamine--corrinoid protein Co-methyltransferase
LLNGSLIWSFEQMIMDCEIFDIIRHMMKGIVVNEETLALDIIRGVGPGGHYLSQKHTLEHMKDLWIAALMDRRPYSEWIKKRDNASDWAREKAKEILKTHMPGPLDYKVESELKRIIQSSEKNCV